MAVARKEQVGSAVLFGLADIGNVPMVPTYKNVYLVYGGDSNM